MQTQPKTSTGPVKSPKAILVDVTPLKLQLVEGKSGKLLVRGEFARCGIATENKRVYPAKVWEKELSRLGKPLQERRVFGELDHPQDGRTQLTRVSHVVTDLKVADGIVVGEAEIVDTERGKSLRALLNAGCKIGVSSRGYGSTVENDKGEQVVQEDYKLVTFDFVAEPADATAYPGVFSEGKALFEGVEIDMDHDQEMADKFAARIEGARKEEREKTEGSLREEFGRTIVEILAKTKAEMREQLRGELLTDPTVAAAKVALDSIKGTLRPFLLPEDAEGVVKQKDAEVARLKKESAEKDLRIKALESENEQLATVAKEIGYKFFLERTLAGDADAELIRTLVGDVKSFASSDDLKAKVTAIREDLSKRKAAEAKAEEERKAQIDAAKAEETKRVTEAETKLKAAEARSQKLAEALERSVEAIEALDLKVHIAERLTNHPKAGKIRSLIESSKISTKEEADALFEQFRAPEQGSDQLEATRAKIRARIGGGHSATPLDEETPSPASARGEGSNYNELGMGLGELKVLAGIGKQK